MSRAALLVLVAALGWLAFPTKPQAQRGGWQYRVDGPTSGAIRSNVAGDAQLEIQCNLSRRIELRIWWQRRRAWRHAQPASIRIDGGPARVMEVDGGDDGFGFTILGDTPDVTLSPGLLAEIKGGSALILEGPAASRMSAQSRTFSLEGAAPVIARAERACGLAPQPTAQAPAAGPAPAAPPPIVLRVREASFSECRERGGRPSTRPNYIQTADFNRDGLPDYVIDENELDCQGGLPPNCGSLGCAGWAFISEPGGYRQVDVGHTHGIRIEQGTILVVTPSRGAPVRYRWGENSPSR